MSQPKHPFREAIRLLGGGLEPPEFVKGYSSKGYTDSQNYELTVWLLEHTPLSWSTGIGLLEAAEHIVEEAVGNANIPPSKDEDEHAKKRLGGREGAGVLRPARVRRRKR